VQVRCGKWQVVNMAATGKVVFKEKGVSLYDEGKELGLAPLIVTQWAALRGTSVCCSWIGNSKFNEHTTIIILITATIKTVTNIGLFRVTV